eukprot:CAMPEP_0173368222 /NCGR_PEP_ID=MMETSP1144-20121109/25348_1 /TAXON_ID=483371 /ORGANISM="non described non described, Strain CCMP2298" /LENGTH=77 /DNA_ID=CAMNT_0014319313 /DNA_START=1 /DNA_END=230 /DNA_ORIENTATION=+
MVIVMVRMGGGMGTETDSGTDTDDDANDDIDADTDDMDDLDDMDAYSDTHTDAVALSPHSPHSPTLGIAHDVIRDIG